MSTIILPYIRIKKLVDDDNLGVQALQTIRKNKFDTRAIGLKRAIQEIANLVAQKKKVPKIDGTMSTRIFYYHVESTRILLCHCENKVYAVTFCGRPLMILFEKRIIQFLKHGGMLANDFLLGWNQARGSARLPLLCLAVHLAVTLGVKRKDDARLDETAQAASRCIQNGGSVDIVFRRFQYSHGQRDKAQLDVVRVTLLDGFRHTTGQDDFELGEITATPLLLLGGTRHDGVGCRRTRAIGHDTFHFDEPFLVLFVCCGCRHDCRCRRLREREKEQLIFCLFYEKILVCCECCCSFPLLREER